MDLSHDFSGQIAEGVSGGEVPQMGGGNDHAAKGDGDSVRSRFRHDSICEISSMGSSCRSYTSRDVGGMIVDSISFSRNLSQQILGVVDSSLIAQVGDKGDRVVADDKEEDDESFMDVRRALENGAVDEDVLILSNRFNSGGATSVPQELPLEERIISVLSVDSVLHLSEKSQKKEKLPRSLDYISYMIHLAVFGVLGGFTRYLLEKLFGPGLLALTGDQNTLYLDLPANMLGSFLMGWFGIVFKADIRHVLSDHIMVGLTTGYLGSLTTFSGWNQKMLELSSEGDWVFALAGIILGMILVNESIRMGVESAEALRRSLLSKVSRDSARVGFEVGCWTVDSRERHKAIMIIMQLLLLFLCGLSATLAKTKVNHATDGAIPWIGSLMSPLSVWGRWYLARLNGQGIGRKRCLKWLPIGTLLANVLAACFMAALSTIRDVVNTKKHGIIISGVQFGFLGGLSTVSTFVAEVYVMRQSGQSGRALAYTALTVLPSFLLGTLIYSVPINLDKSLLNSLRILSSH